MSEQPETTIENTALAAELDNREAVIAIMELYNVDESTAEDLWKKFVDTVKKMKAATEETKEIAGAQ